MISIETTAKNIAEVRGKLLSSLGRGRREALSETLGYLHDRTKEAAKTEGFGRWKTWHPLSRMFSKKSGEWKLRPRILSRGNWNYLLGFVKRWESKSGFRAGIEFGERGDRKMDAKGFEKGGSQQVTEPMRKLFGATRNAFGRGNPLPGVGFFPLRRGTARLTRPPRPFLSEVYRRYGNKASAVGANKVASVIVEEFRK
jgi:hypothetical protein